MPTKYMVIRDGEDFRTIAKKMTEAGWSMNHATARNVLMSALSYLIRDVAAKVGKPLTEDELFLVLKNQDTYDSLSDVLEQAYTQLKQEGVSVT